jgi:NarL family two-component system response regulator LiaR
MWCDWPIELFSGKIFSSERDPYPNKRFSLSVNKAPIRVLVVDDHVIVRKGTRAFLDQIDGIEVIGDTGSGYEAIQLVERLHPDIVLMDLIMPEMDGVQTIQKITSQNQVVRIVVLTSFIAEDRLFAALKDGAHNYLMKDSLPDELVLKIKDTIQGESDLHYSLARRVLNYFNAAQALQLLTPVESEVLQMLEKGLPPAEAAQKCGISKSELRIHIFQILLKLHRLP